VKITRDKTEDCQAFLSIEMEPDEVEEGLKKAYSRLVKKANIPGFRKGKAPRDILERYLGKEALLNDALEHMLPEAYEKAIEEQAIEPFAQPQIELAQLEPPVFKATVPLKPNVELGDYKSIRIEKKPVEVKDEDVDRTIEYVRHNYATWEPVERPIEFNDLVVMDVESTIDGKPFIDQKGAQYQVIKDTPGPAPGFAEQLVGMKQDEEKEFKLKFPSDHPRAEMAGKEPYFKVKIVEIKKELLPELNDDFARQVDSEVETMDALREKISDGLKLRAEEDAKNDYESKVVKEVAEQAKLEYPPVMVEMEISHVLDEQLRRWQMEGQDIEHYLSRTGKTEEELREDFRASATERVIQSLVLSRIAEEEKVEVTEAEIDEEVERLTKGDLENKDKLKEFFNTSQSRDSIRRWLLTRNTVNHLVKIAGGTAEKEA